MSVQVNSGPIRKAYDDFNKTLSNLNKQVRNYNIKTAIKTTLIATLFFASAMLAIWASFSVFGLSFAFVTFSFKLVAAISMAGGITTLFVNTFGNVAKRRLSKNRKQFLDKINKDFKKLLEVTSFPIINSLFKNLIRQSSSHEIYINFKLFKKGMFFSVHKIRLDSYKLVEGRYKKSQLVFQQKMRDLMEKQKSMQQKSARSVFFRYLPAFLRS